MDDRFGGGIGDLRRHRLEVLPGGQHNHSTGGLGVVVLGSPFLDQEQRGPGVDLEGEVQLLGSELFQRLLRTPRVIGDEDVDVTESDASSFDQSARRINPAEIDRQMQGGTSDFCE